MSSTLCEIIRSFTNIILVCLYESRICKLNIVANTFECTIYRFFVTHRQMMIDLALAFKVLFRTAGIVFTYFYLNVDLGNVWSVAKIVFQLAVTCILITCQSFRNYFRAKKSPKGIDQQIALIIFGRSKTIGQILSYKLAYKGAKVVLVDTDRVSFIKSILQ